MPLKRDTPPVATVLHSTIPGIRECCNDMVMQTANEQNTIDQKINELSKVKQNQINVPLVTKLLNFMN